MRQAASSIIIRKLDDKVFVAKRGLNKKLSPGEWETIGGAIEQSEKPEESIKREIREELKVGIKSLKYFADYTFYDQLFHVFIVELDAEPQPSKEDFIEWGWFSRKDIEKMNFALNCKERILDYFRQKSI